MMQTASLFLIALPIVLMLDALWLGVVTRGFYQSHLSGLLAPSVSWVPAGMFYLLFVAGLVVFVIMPALTRESLVQALLFGALFGLICYATYDLTNQATLRDWPLVVTVVDMIWGAALAGFTSGLTYLAATKLFEV